MSDQGPQDPEEFQRAFDELVVKMCAACEADINGLIWRLRTIPIPPEDGMADLQEVVVNTDPGRDGYRQLTSVVGLVGTSLIDHPLRDRIVELLNASRFELRLMRPSPAEIAADVFEPTVQGLVREDADDVISIFTGPAYVIRWLEPQP